MTTSPIWGWAALSPTLSPQTPRTAPSGPPANSSPAESRWSRHGHAIPGVTAPRPLAITATGRLLDAPERVIATTHELSTLARLRIATRHTTGCRHCPGHPMAGLTHGDHIVIGVGERVAYRVTAGRVGIWRMERVA